MLCFVDNISAPNFDYTWELGCLWLGNARNLELKVITYSFGDLVLPPPLWFFKVVSVACSFLIFVVAFLPVLFETYLFLVVFNSQWASAALPLAEQASASFFMICKPSDILYQNRSFKVAFTNSQKKRKVAFTKHDY